MRVLERATKLFFKIFGRNLLALEVPSLLGKFHILFDVYERLVRSKSGSVDRLL